MENKFDPSDLKPSRPDVGMKYSTAAFVALMIFVIGFVAGFAIARKYSPTIELPVVTIKTDTVTVRDTIRGKVQRARIDSIIRVDTVRLQINPAGGGQYKTDTTTRKSVPDTVTKPRLEPDGSVTIPISRKVYKTDDYRAVISGWRASLDSMEVYGKTRTITNDRLETRVINRRPWLAVIAGGGAGYTPDKKVVPWAGIGIGIVLWQNK